MSYFKTTKGAKNSGVVAGIEAREIYGIDENGFVESYDEPDVTLFLTREGILREPTKNGNRKISDERAIKLIGYCGFELLNVFKNETQRGKYKELHHTVGAVGYEIAICDDVPAYCDDGMDGYNYDDWEVAPIESWEIDKALDIAVKNAKCESVEEYVDKIVKLHKRA